MSARSKLATPRFWCRQFPLKNHSEDILREFWYVHVFQSSGSRLFRMAACVQQLRVALDGRDPSSARAALAAAQAHLPPAFARRAAQAVAA